MLKKNKRGISAVVATVLIILITVAAVTIVWAAIIPMIKTNLELGTACLDTDVFIDISSGYTCYDAGKKQANVMVKRRAGDFELAGIQIGLASAGQVESYEIMQGTEPVLALSFDEGYGNTVYDISGKGNDGTINGASWVDGKLGKALSFDGIDDYVDCGNIITVSQNGPATIEGWFKFNQFAIARGTAVNIHNQLYQHLANNFFYLGGGGADYFDSPSTLSLNTWYHIVLTYSGTHETSLLYINGVKDIVNIQTPNFDHASLSPFRISNNGLIDEVKIYNRALTEKEIKKSYEIVEKGKRFFYAELPRMNEARTFKLTGENITEVIVAPIMRIGNRERVCDVTSKVQMPRCT